MKNNFNIICCIGILTLLCGCSTEMKITSFDVVVENEIFYYGCGYNLDDHFFVTYTDSNDAVTVLSSGSYAYTGIDVTTTGTKNVILSVSSPSGYYSATTALSKTVAVKVEKPTVKTGTLKLETAGKLIKGKSILQSLKDGEFAALITFKIDGDQTDKLYAPAQILDDKYWGKTWKITGYDASSDVQAGQKLQLIGYYGDLTTDPASVWLID